MAEKETLLIKVKRRIQELFFIIDETELPGLIGSEIRFFVATNTNANTSINCL